MLELGIGLTYENVRTWETRVTPLTKDFPRLQRRESGGESWYVDETCIKVRGRWSYLHRTTTRDGTLVDCRLKRLSHIDFLPCKKI